MRVDGRFDKMEKRIAALRRQAEAKRRGVIPLIDTLAWPDADRLAFDAADEEGQTAMIEARYGPLATPTRDHPVVCLIVVPLSPVAEEPEEDEPEAAPVPPPARRRGGIQGGVSVDTTVADAARSAEPARSSYVAFGRRIGTRRADRDFLSGYQDLHG